MNGIQEVVGSIPISSTKEIKALGDSPKAFFFLELLPDTGLAIAEAFRLDPFLDPTPSPSAYKAVVPRRSPSPADFKFIESISFFSTLIHLSLLNL